MNNSKKMNKNNIINYVFTIITITLCLAIVSATTTLNNPQSNSNHTTSLEVSCTTSINSTGASLEYNVSIFYNASGGAADSNAETLTIISNSSATTYEFNSTISITSLTDVAKLYNFTCFSDNGTDQEYASQSINVTIDNTDPSCTSGNSLRQRNSIELGSTNKLTCTCSDDIDSSPTITRTIYQPGATTVSVTTSPYTATFSELNKIGVFKFECHGQDYTGNTVSNNATFRVNSDDDTAVNTNIVESELEDDSNAGLIIGIIFIIIIVLAIVVLIITQTSKKKK